MPISSYVIQPAPAQGALVARQLAGMEGCEATASDDGRVVVLVAETPDDAAEEALRRRVEDLPGVRSVALAFAAEESRS